MSQHRRVELYLRLHLLRLVFVLLVLNVVHDVRTVSLPYEDRRDLHLVPPPVVYHDYLLAHLVLVVHHDHQLRPCLLRIQYLNTSFPLTPLTLSMNKHSPRSTMKKSD